MRHRLRPSSGPHFFSLLSVLALLALACFPVLAQAEIQYGEAPPSIKVPDKKDQNQKPEPTAHSSGENPNSSGGTGPGGSGGNSTGGSGNNPSGQGNPSTAGADGTGQGNPSNGTTGLSDAGAVQAGQPVSNQQAADDSSSPLVPILIAIAVLAAISIGVVLYRQRHQDGDGDGAAVSSPEPS